MSSSQEMIIDWRTQTVAMDCATFVLVCTQMLTADNRDKTKLNNSPFVELPGGGFAMIYGTDGAPLVVPPGEEGLLIADIDLSTIDFAKQMIDVVGHYSRPDLLSLNITSEAAKHVNIKQCKGRLYLSWNVDTLLHIGTRRLVTFLCTRSSLLAIF